MVFWMIYVVKYDKYGKEVELSLVSVQATEMSKLS